MWVRAISLFVGGPAAVVGVWSTLDPDNSNTIVASVAFCAFGGVAAIQMICIARAIWNDEL
jgi:hypothetical protein